MNDKQYPGNEEFQKMIAIFDQAGSTLETVLAPMLAQYYNALVELGLPKDVCNNLVVAYQALFLSGILGNRHTGE